MSNPLGLFLKGFFYKKKVRNCNKLNCIFTLATLQEQNAQQRREKYVS